MENLLGQVGPNRKTNDLFKLSILIPLSLEDAMGGIHMYNMFIMLVMLRGGRIIMIHYTTLRDHRLIFGKDAWYVDTWVLIPKKCRYASMSAWLIRSAAPVQMHPKVQ